MKEEGKEERKGEGKEGGKLGGRGDTREQKTERRILYQPTYCTKSDFQDGRHNLIRIDWILLESGQPLLK